MMTGLTLVTIFMTTTIVAKRCVLTTSRLHACEACWIVRFLAVFAAALVLS